jgi:hypothetical protein
MITANTRDGETFPLYASVVTHPLQRVQTFELLALSVKRYAMSVGISAIKDEITFSLNQISNYSEYTALYDMYQIRKVVVYFKSVGTVIYTGNSSGDLPKVRTAIDYNSNTANVPLSQYSTCNSTIMTTNFARTLRPRASSTIYNGVTSAYALAPLNTWFDCVYPAIPHYSLQVEIDTTSIDNQFVYDVDVLFVLAFKQNR